MSKKLNLLAIIILTVLFSSCYSDLDLEDYRPAPKAVLNCAVSPDTIIMASVSRTWFFTEDNPNVTLRDAKVELYINDTFKEQMQWTDMDETGSLNAKGFYVSTVVPKTGDKVKVVAATEHGNVWAEDIVPPKRELIDTKISHKYYDNGSIIIDPNGITPQLAVEIKYEITFQDDINTTDYYLIRISGNDPSRPMGSLDYSSDPIFIGQKSILEGSVEGKFLGGQGGRTFSDETINGSKYTLIVKETGIQSDYSNRPQLIRKITLYTLSKAYYQYLSSLQYIEDDELLQNMAGYGLAEPIKVFSNIQGGIGILGASHSTDMTVDLKEIITE